MKKILITEFMEQESVNLLASKFEVKYNPKLSDNIDNLIGEVHLYDGLIVRNKTLVNEFVSRNDYSINWDGRNENGQSVASGQYFYVMKAPGGFTSTEYMTLLK